MFFSIYDCRGGDITVSFADVGALYSLFPFVPEELEKEVSSLIEKGCIRLSEISEIRLRDGRQASLSLDGVNFRLKHICTSAEMQRTLSLLCKGSVYAYENSLKNGFISLERGVRVAVSAQTRYANGGTFRSPIPQSVVFRVPIHAEGQSEMLARQILKEAGSMLIFSPPAVGKTTVLRDLCITLAGKYAKRVAVIDSREEIDDGLIPKNCLIDTLRGCERREGIEWALRTLSPELIAVDELSARDTELVCGAALRGVPIICTYHAADFFEVLSVPSLSSAYNSGALRYLVKLTRKRGEAPEFEIRESAHGGKESGI